MTKPALSGLEKMAKGASIIIALVITSSLLGFLFRVLVARWLGPQDLGIYTLAETFLGMAVAFSGLGIIQAITRYYPYYRHRQPASLAAYHGFALVWPLTLSLLTALFLIFAAPYLVTIFDLSSNLAWLFRMVGFILPWRIYSEINRRLLLATDHYFWGDFTYFIVEKAILVFGVLWIAYHHLPVQALVGVLSLAVITAALLDGILWRLLAGHTVIKFWPTRQQYRKWLLFSWPLWLTTLSSFILNWGDNLVITRVLGPTQMGFYAAAFALASFLDFFQKMVSQVFLPTATSYYAARNYAAIANLYRVSAVSALMLTLPAALPLIFWSRSVITLIYGPSYQLASWSLVLLAFGYLVNVATGLGTNILVVHGKTKWVVYIFTTTACLNVTLNFLFASRFGITGVALATAFVMILTNLLSLLAASLTQSLALPVLQIMRILLAAGLASLFLWTGSQTNYSWSVAGFKFSVAIIVYVAALCALRVVNLSQLQWYKSLFFKPKQL